MSAGTQNDSIAERKASPLMANVCFQTAPKTHLPACRWRRTEAESSPWSAAAAQTPQFRVTSGSESGTASRRLETRMCLSLLRGESISAAPPTNTEARTLPLSLSGSEVSSRLGSHGNSPCPLPYASSVSAINCSNGMDQLSTPTSIVCHSGNGLYAAYVAIAVAVVLILIAVVVAVR